MKIIEKVLALISKNKKESPDQVGTQELFGIKRITGTIDNIANPLQDFTFFRPKRSTLQKLCGPIDPDNLLNEWPREKELMGNILAPPELLHAFKKGHVYGNKLMAAPLLQAFKNIVDRKLYGQVKTFDGCFNIRNVRGGATLSNHSFGLALDINADTNPLGHEPTMSRELVACFTDAGFVWGGTWGRPDGMHFQFVTEA